MLQSPLSPLFRVYYPILLALFIVGGPGCANRRGGSATLSQPTESGYGTLLDEPEAGASYLEFQEIPLSGRPSRVHFDSDQVQRDLFTPIHFGVDQYDIPSGELPRVRKVADYLTTSQASVIVAGHTDATSTSEYNRNLGERRALSVRSTLIQLGVAASQIQTVSFGEDRPLRPGHTAADHAVNRRAEFGIFRNAPSER